MTGHVSVKEQENKKVLQVDLKKASELFNLGDEGKETSVCNFGRSQLSYGNVFS